jgi:hypothetical protein
MMRKNWITTLAAASLAVTGMLAGALPANAATARVKVYASNDGWHAPSVSPAAVYVGNGNAQRVLRVRWTRWGAASARGSGRLYPGDRAAVVALSGVRVHDGTRYFWKMTWKRDGHPVSEWKFRNGWWDEACFPLAASGACYEPGEFCPSKDHGASGVAGDGKSIRCENSDGWRWKSVA